MIKIRETCAVALGTLVIASIAEFVAANESTNQHDVEPNWTLILLVFIISSAIAALVGIVTLARDPYVPEPPVFSTPTFLDTEPDVPMNPHSGYPIMTTYRQYPLEYGSDSYPMRSMPSGQEDRRSHHRMQQQPIMITTQKM